MSQANTHIPNTHNPSMHIASLINALPQELIPVIASYLTINELFDFIGAYRAQFKRDQLRTFDNACIRVINDYMGPVRVYSLFNIAAISPEYLKAYYDSQYDRFDLYYRSSYSIYDPASQNKLTWVSRSGFKNIIGLMSLSSADPPSAARLVYRIIYDAFVTKCASVDICRCYYASPLFADEETTGITVNRLLMEPRPIINLDKFVAAYSRVRGRGNFLWHLFKSVHPSNQENPTISVMDFESLYPSIIKSITVTLLMDK